MAVVNAVHKLILQAEVIKPFLCSTKLSMKFSLLINMKMLTIVGILIFISRENFHAQLWRCRDICFLWKQF